MFRKISSAFTSGAFGGIANSLSVWFFGIIGITSMLGVAIHPHLTPKWLYPRIVWGGLWGLLFIIPVLKGSVLLRGIIFSAGPTAAMLFIVFPKMGKGVYGLAHGTLTPLLVVFFNLLWGVAAAFWYTKTGE